MITPSSDLSGIVGRTAYLTTDGSSATVIGWDRTDSGDSITVRNSTGTILQWAIAAVEIAAEASSAIAQTSYNVTAYGAVGDGLSDDTSAIQAAIDAAKAAGGGTVYLPVGDYRVTSSLMFRDAHGVHIVGDGPVGNRFVPVADNAITQITWGGTSSPVFTMGTSSRSQTHVMSSASIQRIGIDCASNATMAIHATSITGCLIQDVSIKDPASYGIYMDCLGGNITGGSVAEAADNQFNTIERVNVDATLGPAIYLDGNSVANTSLNTFRQIAVYHENNDAFVFGNSDGNTLIDLLINTRGGGTGAAIRFKADATSTNQYARYNTVIHPQPGGADIIAEGGTGGQESTENMIVAFGNGNTGLNNLPTIESNATLSYITPRMLGQLGAHQLICAGGTDAVFASAVAILQRANVTSEAIRIYNLDSNHSRWTDGTNEWAIRLDSSGDFEILPITYTITPTVNMSRIRISSGGGDHIRIYDGTLSNEWGMRLDGSGNLEFLRVAGTGEAIVNGDNIAHSDGTTGGTGSAGAGKQYVELDIGGTVYKVLHDGTV